MGGTRRGDAVKFTVAVRGSGKLVDAEIGTNNSTNLYGEPVVIVDGEPVGPGGFWQLYQLTSAGLTPEEYAELSVALVAAGYL